MKTRIFHTRFWMDSYVLSLPAKGRLLFNFLISNETVGFTGFYEMPISVIQLSTGLTSEEIRNFLEKFQKDRKTVYYKEWVYLVNHNKYQSYTGEKNDIAKQNEDRLIPKEIKKYCMDSVSIGYLRTADTPINHKPKIINNNKGVVKGDEKSRKEYLDNVTFQKQLQEQFPHKNVPSETEKMKDWLASSGRVKKDYAAFARNWLRNEKYSDNFKPEMVVKIR